MQYLINLPSIGRVKKEAERYRGILRADEIKEKEDRKARIIEEFNRYMDAELRGNPKPSIQRRAHTLQWYISFYQIELESELKDYNERTYPL